MENVSELVKNGRIMIYSSFFYAILKYFGVEIRFVTGVWSYCGKAKS